MLMYLFALYLVLPFSEIIAPDQKSTSGIYEIEHAIISYNVKNSMPRYKDTLSRSFISYGKKEAITTVGVNNYPIIKILKIDTIQYMLDSSQCLKSARKMQFGLENLDMRLIKSVEAREFAITPTGTEYFLSVPCKKFHFRNTSLNTSGEIWIWKNIPLKIIITSNGNIQKTEAFKIDTISNINPSLFFIPSDVEIIDVTNVNNN